MSRQLSVRVPDELAEKIDTEARHLGKTRSDIVRDALASVALTVEPDPISFSELLKRAATLRALQPEPTDVAALIRDIRDAAPLRLRLMRLTVPLVEADLA
jgi:Arc/MetJ-type ribon-helix-helix transcriptional regulator